MTKLHDDFCMVTRFRFAACTCGGDEGESYAAIVRQNGDDFLRRLDEIRIERGNAIIAGRSAVNAQGTET